VRRPAGAVDARSGLTQFHVRNGTVAHERLRYLHTELEHLPHREPRLAFQEGAHLRADRSALPVRQWFDVRLVWRYRAVPCLLVGERNLDATLERVTAKRA
jgi:hypothetical protein